MLIEWIIALECITAKNDGQGISKMYPVLIGTLIVLPILFVKVILLLTNCRILFLILA